MKHSGFTTCNTWGRENRLLWVNEGHVIVRFHCARLEININLHCIYIDINVNQCMVCRLNFDRRTGQYSSTSDDITVSVLGFGLMETVETISKTSYF